MTNFLGLLAGFLTTFAVIPQIVKIWKTKMTRDISLMMYLVFFVGVIFWLVYGILINSLPIIISNCVSIILTSSVIYLKIRYK